MAYFDANQTAGTATQTALEARTALDRFVRSVLAGLNTFSARSSKSPQDLVAAQHRAEAARRAVNNLLR